MKMRSGCSSACSACQTTPGAGLGCWGWGGEGGAGRAGRGGHCSCWTEVVVAAAVLVLVLVSVAACCVGCVLCVRMCVRCVCVHCARVCSVCAHVCGVCVCPHVCAVCVCPRARGTLVQGHSGRSRRAVCVGSPRQGERWAADVRACVRVNACRSACTVCGVCVCTVCGVCVHRVWCVCAPCVVCVCVAKRVQGANEDRQRLCFDIYDDAAKVQCLRSACSPHSLPCPTRQTQRNRELGTAPSGRPVSNSTPQPQVPSSLTFLTHTHTPPRHTESQAKTLRPATPCAVCCVLCAECCVLCAVCCTALGCVVLCCELCCSAGCATLAAMAAMGAMAAGRVDGGGVLAPGRGAASHDAAIAPCRWAPALLRWHARTHALMMVSLVLCPLTSHQRTTLSHTQTHSRSAHIHTHAEICVGAHRHKRPPPPPRPSTHAYVLAHIHM